MTNDTNTAQPTGAADGSRTIAEVMIALERQLEAVEQIAALAEKQAKLIDEGDTDGLLTVLGRRQKLIDQFTAAQQALGDGSGAAPGSGAAAGLESVIERADASARARIRALIDRISEALAAVAQIDDRDQGRLREVQQQTRKELSAVGTTRQARAAYMTGRASHNRYADQQG